MKLARRSIAAALLFAAGTLSYAQLEGSKPDTQSVSHPVHRHSGHRDYSPARRSHGVVARGTYQGKMFIHWGLYSIPAGEWNGKRTPHIGEWIMNDLSIPVADYKAFAKDFNPTGFSAHDIVALAKSAQA